MPRRLRIEDRNALYHVINRGNYRSDVFGTEGAVEAFAEALGDACERYGWKIHAYVIMRNHFHLALETPVPNLADGMHWLLSAFSTRFNRFRKEQGHVFQGRYRALLIEDAAALVRVVDYIHLNPVRAHVVQPADVATFRWSSLQRFVQGDRPPWLIGRDLLHQHNLCDDVEGWASYVSNLAALALDERAQRELGFDGMSVGWAIGTTGWRRAVARDLEAMHLGIGADPLEIKVAKETRWSQALADELRKRKLSARDVTRDRKGAPWKREIAVALRQASGAPYAWIAKALNMGKPTSVRVYVCQAGRI